MDLIEKPNLLVIFSKKDLGEPLLGGLSFGVKKRNKNFYRDLKHCSG